MFYSLIFEEALECIEMTRPDTINFFSGYAQNGEPVITEPSESEIPVLPGSFHIN